MATPLEKQFAEVLGLEDEIMFPRLPMEVGSCEQGPRCCWRWLTRAALEEIAGACLGHRGLAEIVTQLRRDVASAIELRSWAEAAREELEQAVLNKKELEKLRRAHEELQQEVKELRTLEPEMQRLREENKDLQDAYERMKKEESETQLNLTRLRAERVMLVDGDLAAARARAEHAQREIENLQKAQDEYKSCNADLERHLATARRDLGFEKERNIQMKQEAEEAIRRMRLRKKRGLTKPAVPRFR